MSDEHKRSLRATIGGQAAVACPAEAAQAFLERDFELQHSQEQRVALHVRVPVWGSLSLDKEVDAVLSPAAGGADCGMRVTWEPGQGLFPRFHGLLRALPTGPESAILELRGEYEPPGGTLGMMFDRMVGRRLARATIDNLLARVGRTLSAEYERRVGLAVR